MVQEVAHWLRVQNPGIRVYVRRATYRGKSGVQMRGGNWIVEYFTISTKTRASAMASRALCMVNNLLLGKVKFSVNSELTEGQTPPKKREDLRKYRIFVEVEVTRYRGLPKTRDFAMIMNGNA